MTIGRLFVQTVALIAFLARPTTFQSRKNTWKLRIGIGSRHFSGHHPTYQQEGCNEKEFAEVHEVAWHTL